MISKERLAAFRSTILMRRENVRTYDTGPCAVAKRDTLSWVINELNLLIQEVSSNSLVQEDNSENEFGRV